MLAYRNCPHHCFNFQVPLSFMNVLWLTGFLRYRIKPKRLHFSHRGSAQRIQSRVGVQWQSLCSFESQTQLLLLLVGCKARFKKTILRLILIQIQV